MIKIKPLLKKTENKIRKICFRHRSKHLLNRDVTIISNSCLGGVIYNTLDLKFLSPTINLAIKGVGFIHFVEHLQEYLEKGTFEDLHRKIGYYFGPYALLKCEGLPDIEIEFTHYREFKEAIESWDRRKKRINYKKIFLLIEARYDRDIKLIDSYLNLPYEKMILTSSKNTYKSDRVKHMKYYDKHGEGHPITEFISPFGKRGIDEYNFVSDIFNREY